MPSVNLTVKVVYRFVPFADYAGLSPSEMKAAKELCNAEIKAKFGGDEQAVAGPMPSAYLLVLDDGSALEDQIQEGLRASIRRSAASGLTFDETFAAEETVYTVVNGEVICEHPYAALDSNQNWEVDVGSIKAGLKAQFLFSASWPTPLGR